MNQLEDSQAKLLAEVIEGRFGLAFSGVRRDILASRLETRLRALHLPDFLEYYHYLRAHPDREAEFAELARRLTNNETYFFREPQHFEVITRQVLPRRNLVRGGPPLRVLSAGCSSGEEPYSLVIALQNAGLELAGIPWEIDACDLNRDRLAQAREGIYEPNSLRTCDEETRRRYFTEAEGRFTLRPRHRKGVNFFEANLSNSMTGLGWPIYDAILCRNVLIYFSEETFFTVIARFARALAPGGYLLLGHSESLIDKVPQFVPELAEGVMVYRRVEAE